MTRQEALTNFKNMLGRKPTFYAVVYLLLIPTFAFIYWSLGDEFYHSTVKYEESVREDHRRLTEDLRDSIVKSYRRVHDDSWETEDGWRFDVACVTVTRLVVDQGIYTLNLRMSFANKKKDSFYPYGLRATFSKDPLFPQKNAKKYLFPLCAESSSEQSPMPLNELFPFDPETVRGTFGSTGCRDNKPCGFLVTSEELRDRLIAYSSAMEGFPSQASGSFDRMLYLSAVTITTVGYGDIVPITARARMLLALEAILGIVLIGLFLNALAHQIKAS